jgi:spermidine synthase
VIDAGADSAWPQRFAAYRAARDRFIAVGQRVQPSADLQGMLRQVREPLLDVLRISPDFRPAYDPLLSMAVALGRSDPIGARQLLSELQQAQPARTEAALVYSKLPAEKP